MFEGVAMEMSSMRKVFTIMALVVGLAVLSGCSIKTPEIHGTVLDEATNEPVEGAWVKASIEKGEVTGGRHSAISIAEPHTRTGKDGRFVIPSRRLGMYLGFGIEVLSLSIGVGTVDDRGGRINYFNSKRKHYGPKHGDVEEVLGRNKLDLTVYVKPTGRSEDEYFNYLQHRYRECTTGRSSVERPVVEGGCDAWELDYVITKHERFLERLGEPKTSDQRVHYSGAVEQLAYLYKKRSDYEKALVAFKDVRDFWKAKMKGKKSGYYYSQLKEYETQIKELKGLLKE